MGLLVSVFRDARLGDSSNGGISSRHTTLCVVNVEGPFKPNDEIAPVMLVAGAYGAPILVPAVFDTFDPDGVTTVFKPMPSNTAEYAGPMYGGALADSSDGRWGRAVRKIIVDGMKARGWDAPAYEEGAYATNSAVPIHDRVETWATYEALSR